MIPTCETASRGIGRKPANGGLLHIAYYPLLPFLSQFIEQHESHANVGFRDYRNHQHNTVP